MKRLIIPLALAVAGCAQTPPPEPQIITKEVDVPVPQPCKALVDIGSEPVYPDTDAAIAAAPDIFSIAKLYAAGRLLRVQRLAKYVAAKASCAG